VKYQITTKDLIESGNLEFLAKQVVEGFITGLHKSPFHGFSVEFAEHRQYNPGESVRYLDWKLYARTDKMYLKKFEEETNLRCQILIDNSSSMYFPESGLSKIRFSVIAAASLIHLLKKQRDATGLSIFSDKVEFSSPAKSSLVHSQMLFARLEELLNSPTKNSKSNISESLHQIAESLHKRSLVIVFSDMFQSGDTGVFDALQHLKYNKHDVVLFHVSDKLHELNFEYGNRPYVFIDSETNEKIKLHPQAIKDEYISEFRKFSEDLKVKCAQYKIDFVDASVDNNFNQILLPFFVKRSKLY